jgi:plastocyanin
VRMRYLPWMAAAAIALVGAPALAAGGDPPSTAAVTTYDQGTEATAGFRDASQSDLADHSVAITTGGTVTFSFPEGAGTMPHNVKFDGALKPTSCVQTKFLTGQPQAPLPIPPLPSYLQNAGWEGNCTFGAVGTYSFVCSAHPAMTGTVVVTAPTPTATATATATVSPDPTATPVPVAATPVPSPTPPPPSVVPAPKISSAVFKRSKRTITIAGTSQAGGKVKVELAYKNGKATRKKTLSLPIKAGKFSGTIKLSAADARKAQKLTVTASYNGTSLVKKSVTIKK